MEQNAKIFVAGHRGLLGSAVRRQLLAQKYSNLILCDRSELDLTDRKAVYAFFEKVRPDYVFLCAAKVGGIQANTEEQADFLLQNLLIETSVISAAADLDVKKLLFVASSCVYPRESPNPIRETEILKGPFEPTNEGYAVAKVAGLKLCQAYRNQYKKDFIVALPSNLFGIGDHYDPRSSHLLPALIRKVHEAKVAGRTEIEVWGTGNPRREFMSSDDCAHALVFLMSKYSSLEPINVGVGVDHSITELANLVAEVLEYPVQLRFDRSKPDGMPRKLLDVSRLFEMGWKPQVSLREAIRIAYQDYLSRISS